jgi:heme/copper-type cytochrome/quinol oxidase subunit 4
VAGIVPLLGPIVIVVSAVWTLVAVVVAVRQALDYRSTGRAIGVCIIGWLVQIVIFVVLGGILHRSW